MLITDQWLALMWEELTRFFDWLLCQVPLKVGLGKVSGFKKYTCRKKSAFMPCGWAWGHPGNPSHKVVMFYYLKCVPKNTTQYTVALKESVHSLLLNLFVQQEPIITGNKPKWLNCMRDANFCVHTKFRLCSFNNAWRTCADILLHSSVRNYFHAIFFYY